MVKQLNPTFHHLAAQNSTVLQLQTPILVVSESVGTRYPNHPVVMDDIWKFPKIDIWRFLKIGVPILSSILAHDFEFPHIMI